jgi:hypothetical protein
MYYFLITLNIFFLIYNSDLPEYFAKKIPRSEVLKLILFGTARELREVSEERERDPTRWDKRKIRFY